MHDVAVSVGQDLDFYVPRLFQQLLQVEPAVLLLAFKAACQVLVHHYAIMDNHIHLVLYASDVQLLSDYMRQVFGLLGRFINRGSGRSGRVFGDRARTPVIQDRRYLFTVMRYIDLNPVYFPSSQN